MSPRPLPPLPRGPLSLAAARDLGLADHDWRDRRLLRVTQGVRAVGIPLGLRERAAAFALALPDDVAFSHVTAARLWGLPVPTRFERAEVLDVIRETGRARVERRGCRGHRGLERREVRTHAGVRLTAPADTWVDLAAVGPGPLTVAELVAVGDAVATLTAPPGVSRTREQVRTALEPLTTCLERRGASRGSAALTVALALVRPGVRSPMESRTRLMFVRAGFPEPEPCAPLDARGGGWLAEGDLVWREQRVVAEYQGAVHSGRAARSADAWRAGLLGDEGWTVLEVFAEDHTDPHRRRALLVRAARALGLDPSTLALDGGRDLRGVATRRRSA